MGAESGPKYADEEFSPKDMQNANKSQKPSYLGTPSGKIFRYDPPGTIPPMRLQ